MTAARGFTYLNLFIVIVIIVAVAVAIVVIRPSSAHHNSQAMLTAEQKLLQPLIVALDEAYASHRRDPEGMRITSVRQIPALLDEGRLPDGLSIAGSALRDDDGRLFALLPESSDRPARFIRLGATAPATPAAAEMAETADGAEGEEAAAADDADASST